MEESLKPFGRIPVVGRRQADFSIDVRVKFALPDDIECLAQLVVIKAFQRHAMDGRLGTVGLMRQDIFHQPEAAAHADQLALFGDRQRWRFRVGHKTPVQSGNLAVTLQFSTAWARRPLLRDTFLGG